MPSNKSIFISVKYNHDHLLERSLSAYLKRRGHDTYRHKGTVDVLDRAAPSPVLFDSPSILIAPWLLKHGRQVEPQEVSPSLVSQLVDDVLNHDLVVVAWTEAYAESYWCALELKAALLSKKPLVLIRADFHPLSQELSRIVGTERCSQVDIIPTYRTSDSVSAIEALLPRTQEFLQHSEIVKELLEFATEYAVEYRESPLLSEEERIRYEQLVWKLRMADDHGNLHNMIKYFSDRGALDQGFRPYLEYAAAGLIEARLEPWYYPYVLGEILDVKFLHPVLPKKLRQFYESRITEAFHPPQQQKIENLINEMVEECLFAREFVEYFGYLLKEVRRGHGPLVADMYWGLCASRIQDAV